MMRLLVYSKKGCPFCSLLKAELATRRISYESFDLSDDDVRASFYENSGKKSVPQVYLTNIEATLTSPSGESLGGWSDLSKSLDSLPERLSARKGS
jgi:glutaredoxin